MLQILPEKQANCKIAFDLMHQTAYINFMNKKLIINAIFGVALALCAAVLLFTLQTKPPAATKETTPYTINVSGIGGPFTLTTHKGETITEKNLVGHYSLLFFGFTYCPAICPTELQKITETYAALPKAVQDKLKLYFITIDPERDTKDILKNYVELFHPKLIGVYGTIEQTDAIKKAYKIYAAKVPQGDSYTMDHSSFIYLIGKDGKLIRVFKGSDKSDFIKAELTKIIN